MEPADDFSTSPRISVFTPTFNRGHLLHKLYQSLCNQTRQDFEWIIVNDGSIDDTESVIKGFISEGILTINHKFQENAGKQVAINSGVAQAKGELFFIVDSDDWLAPDALESILFHWDNVKTLADSKSFAGVSGNRMHSDGSVNGGDVDYDILDTNAYDYRQRRKYKGDKAEAYLTSILKCFPFPEFENEKYCPESLIWNRIANNYKLRYFNKGIYFGDYLEGGITDRSVIIRAIYPRYTALVYSELGNTTMIPLVRRIKAYINYWRFSPYNRHQSFEEKFTSVKTFWSVICIPVGYLLYLREKKMISKKV